MSSRQTQIVIAVVVSAVGALTASSLRSAGSEPYSGKEWAAPGGDWAGTRYSTLSQITTRNIKQLGGAWVVETPDRAEATPMVKDGRMFVVTAAGVISALDPATGATLWTFKSDTPFSGKRGVGIGDGLLFAGLRNSNVMAISQETGKLVWTSEHPKEIPSQGMATAPAYGNGVVVGVVSLGDNFLHGRAIGYDVEDREISLELRRRAGTWRAGSRDLAAGQRHLEVRRRRDLDHALGRRRAGVGLPPDRQCRAAIWRRTEARQQPLQQFRGRARSQDRKDAVVFPDRSSRHLGTRSEHAAGVVRHGGRRAIAQGPRGDADRRHPVHPRPRDRQAAGSG